MVHESRRLYAGLGTRTVPEEVAAVLENLGARLARQGWTLRSGGSPGADTAWEAGALSAGGAVELYLPWPAFNGRTNAETISLERPTPAAYALARPLHPAWVRVGRRQQPLLARDVHQVLGPGLDDPVAFVACWTHDGAFDAASVTPRTGGTGQAIRLAAAWGIPVFNLRHEEHLARLEALLAEGSFSAKAGAAKGG